MGDAVEALALEEAIQPAEVKQNHGGRLRIHPSRLPATIVAPSVFVFVVIWVWLGPGPAGWVEEEDLGPEERGRGERAAVSYPEKIVHVGLQIGDSCFLFWHHTSTSESSPDPSVFSRSSLSSPFVT